MLSFLNLALHWPLWKIENFVFTLERKSGCFLKVVAIGYCAKGLDVYSLTTKCCPTNLHCIMYCVNLPFSLIVRHIHTQYIHDTLPYQGDAIVFVAESEEENMVKDKQCLNYQTNYFMLHSWFNTSTHCLF